jgi:hypothetical protein
LLFVILWRTRIPIEARMKDIVIAAFLDESGAIFVVNIPVKDYGFAAVLL